MTLYRKEDRACFRRQIKKKEFSTKNNTQCTREENTDWTLNKEQSLGGDYGRRKTRKINRSEKDLGRCSLNGRWKTPEQSRM